jgi:hypothetical protein
MLWRSGATALDASHFPAAIFTAAGIALLAPLLFTRLPPEAGATLLRPSGDRPAS